jgi:transposase
MRRTAIVNQIRGLLLERGTTLRKGRRYLDEALPGILAGGPFKLSGAVLVLVAELKQELEQLAEKIDRADKSVEKIARENEACRRLIVMLGVGPVMATAIIATIGNGAAFRKGRDFAAWLGVVPEEHSTGGKQTLWKIPQPGNPYLRRLFVQGARTVMQHRTNQSSGLSAWLAQQLTARSHQNVAIVALANKLARMAWAVLAKNEVYRPPLLNGATIRGACG